MIQNGKKECIERYPLGNNFIGDKKECKAACEKADGLHYEKREEFSQEEINYVIYECIKNLTNISIGYYIVDEPPNLWINAPLIIHIYPSTRWGAMTTA